MFIFDEVAEGKLIKTLEAIRLQAGTSMARCIHFKLSQKLEAKTISQDTRQNIIASAMRPIQSVNPEMYVCEDGDIFILAPTLPSKDAKRIIAEVSLQLRLPATEEYVRLYELGLYINTLLVIVEQKVEKRRKAIEAIQRQRKTEEAEHKRQLILNDGIPRTDTCDIGARRKQRGKPELMIIEDDAFSRRLVKNVLEKHYSLTGLGTAEVALATYTHLAPDVLFLDIDLPDVTGHELLSKIMAFDPEAYIIMLSGNADKDNITQAMSKGAKGFIAKPFSKEKLFQYIERCPTIKH